MVKLTLIFLLLLSCSKSTLTTGDIDQSKKSLKLLFTGNINGELEPCGCRQFPLGGINHVHGLISELGKDANIIFVDTGDTFFKQNFEIRDEAKSQLFRAKNLSTALSTVGLNLKVLGDQDFAYGEEKLAEILKDEKFNILGTNIKSSLIKTIPMKEYKFDQHRLFIIGVSDQEITKKNQKQIVFEDTIKSIRNQVNELKQKGFDDKNKFHHLILLSHSGMSSDKIIASQVKELDWILGSHTQNFTQKPITVGKTKILQMLSRNHYIGDIEFKKDSHEAIFSYHEVNQSLAEKVKNNPLTTFVDQFQKELNQIQENEQGLNSTITGGKKNDRLPTASSCMDCHDEQGAFWQETAHSLAYKTLLDNDSNNDLDCLKCHSLGLKQSNGFNNVKDMVITSKGVVKDDYWKEVFSKKHPKNAIRDWSKESIKELSEHWYYTDIKFKVSHNYANVQCLNCHDHSPNHSEYENKYKSDPAKIKIKCLECHNSDQSSHWYDDSGRLIENKFSEALEQVKCPKTEE